MAEFESVIKLKRLLDNNYKIEKIQPPVFASDAEVNIVTVVLLCPDGTDNPTIVNLVAKYYNLARSGSNPLMLLDCKGYNNDSQTDCRAYTADGKLTYANRYDIRSASFFHISNNKNFSPAEMFQKFVQRMNSQIPYNKSGKINAVPIIVYHNLSDSINDCNAMASTITITLFAQEMQYLHDNGFRVLVLNRLGYDANNNVFYLNTVHRITTGATATNSVSIIA